MSDSNKTVSKMTASEKAVAKKLSVFTFIVILMCIASAVGACAMVDYRLAMYGGVTIGLIAGIYSSSVWLNCNNEKKIPSVQDAFIVGMLDAIAAFVIGLGVKALVWLAVTLKIHTWFIKVYNILIENKLAIGMITIGIAFTFALSKLLLHHRKFISYDKFEQFVRVYDDKNKDDEE